jgi:hypothetical protein
MKTNFNDFINEKFDGEHIFSEQAAMKWFQKIKQDPELEPYINNFLLTDPQFKQFQKIVNRVLKKYRKEYRKDLYPKEIDYVRELLLELPFEIEE